MDKIVATKDVLGGKPRIAGTRISVDLIVDYLAAGYGIDEIKRDYPHLKKEQIEAVLKYIEKRVVKERTKLEPQTC